MKEHKTRAKQKWAFPFCEKYDQIWAVSLIFFWYYRHSIINLIVVSQNGKANLSLERVIEAKTEEGSKKQLFIITLLNNNNWSRIRRFDDYDVQKSIPYA
jgi:hypothetical protein